MDADRKEMNAGNSTDSAMRFCINCGEPIVGETIFWRATDGPWHGRCMPKPHEHEFKECGYAGLGAGRPEEPTPLTGCGVWWWACRCGLHVWHQRGNLERGILAGHFVRKENAPSAFGG